MPFDLQFIKAYRSWLKNLSEIWDKPITKITYTDVAPLIFGYYDKHKYTGTISLITLGKSIFKYAERKLKIQLDNPFLEIKISKKSNKTKKMPNVLTFKQMTAAFKKIENPEHRWLAMCAGLAGLRISEGRWLAPNAFNLKRNQIEVTQQRTADDTIKDCLKSDDGERIIPLHPLLKAEYKRLPVPISINTLLIQTYYHSEIMSKAIRKTGYPEASTHTLRHSFATICIQNGMDFKTLASIMGDKLETIIKTYSHVNTEMRDAAKEIIKNF